MAKKTKKKASPEQTPEVTEGLSYPQRKEIALRYLAEVQEIMVDSANQLILSPEKRRLNHLDATFHLNTALKIKEIFDIMVKLDLFMPEEGEISSTEKKTPDK